MRELKLVTADSDAQSLVLVPADTADTADASGDLAAQTISGYTDSDAPEEFFIVVTDDLRALVGGDAGFVYDADSDAPMESNDHGVVQAFSALRQEQASDADTDNADNDAASAGDAVADAAESVSATDDDSESTGDDNDNADNTGTVYGDANVATIEANADTETTVESDYQEPEATESYTRELSPEAAEAAKSAAISGRRARGFGSRPNSGRPHRSTIALSPRVIQARIRHGASIAELAEEADTDESRIEPYAWPIMQERARITELAHTAYPISSEGGGKNTLWEVLATSFAARDETISDAEWDARQDDSRNWIVTVTWNKNAAGQTNAHVAEFMFEQDHIGGTAIVHPMNSVASDLVDPRFGRPVRSVTPVTSIHPADRTMDDPADMLDDDPTPGDAEPRHASSDHKPTDIFANTSGTAGEASGEDGVASENETTDPHVVESPEGRDSRAPQDPDEEFFLQPRGGHRKRRRKAVTPHWEDVLLGVRTNPKKKR